MKLTFSLPTTTQKIIVGYSGGLDSHCLLDYLVQQPGLKSLLFVIHVNHGISPHAQHWEQHCAKICREYDVPFEAHSVQLDPSLGSSLESIARTARYAIFRQHMDEQTILMTAHHQDDQAETVLLNLLRGSGPMGCAAMPARKSFEAGEHFRPLLDITRAELEGYAAERKLKWIEDESNFSLDHDRNYLRLQIIPRLNERWPTVSKTLARSAKHMGSAATVLEEIAVVDAQICIEDNRLCMTQLQLLSQERQMNVIRYWLKQVGCTPPSTVYLERIINEAMHARSDANPAIIWRGGIVRRFEKYLYAFRSEPKLPLSMLQWNWEEQGVIPLPHGKLSLTPATDVGLDKRKLPKMLTIKFRQGGETIKPYPHKQTHRIKNLLQKWHIPTWERARIPLIYAENELIAVSDYCYNADYITHEIGQRLKLNYQPIQL